MAAYHDELWCVTSKGVCVMVYDTIREKWVYIPEKRWLKMTEEQKERYV